MKSVKTTALLAAATIAASKYVYNRAAIARAAHQHAKTLGNSSYRVRLGEGFKHAWSVATAAKAAYLATTPVSAAEIAFAKQILSKPVKKQARKYVFVNGDYLKQVGLLVEDASGNFIRLDSTRRIEHITGRNPLVRSLPFYGGYDCYTSAYLLNEAQYKQLLLEEETAKEAARLAEMAFHAEIRATINAVNAGTYTPSREVEYLGEDETNEVSIWG